MWKEEDKINKQLCPKEKTVKIRLKRDQRTHKMQIMKNMSKTHQQQTCGINETSADKVQVKKKKKKKRMMI